MEINGFKFFRNKGENGKPFTQKTLRILYYACRILLPMALFANLYISIVAEDKFNTVLAALISGFLISIAIKPTKLIKPSDLARIEEKTELAVEKQLKRMMEDQHKILPGGTREILSRLCVNIDDLTKYYDIPSNDKSLAMIETCITSLWHKADQQGIV